MKICKYNDGIGRCSISGERCEEGPCDCEELIEYEPVRHGRWVDKMVRDWHCSECGKKASFDGYCYDDKPNYCPNCGARMDGDAK